MQLTTMIYIENHLWLVLVLLLGSVLLATVLWVQKASEDRSKAIWRYLLIWPILLDHDAAAAKPGESHGRQLVILVILLVVVAALAIVFAPSKTLS